MSDKDNPTQIVHSPYGLPSNGSQNLLRCTVFDHMALICLLGALHKPSYHFVDEQRICAKPIHLLSGIYGYMWVPSMTRVCVH